MFPSSSAKVNAQMCDSNVFITFRPYTRMSKDLLSKVQYCFQGAMPACSYEKMQECWEEVMYILMHSEFRQEGVIKYNKSNYHRL